MPRKPPLYSDELAKARKLRLRPTDVEQRLWFRLRSRCLAGAKFRRQHPLGPFVVDFYCADAKLVIELDGGGHAEYGQVARDSERTRQLEARGLRILRFWNSDVLQNMDGVLKSILEALQLPLPDPLPAGEGRE